MTALPKEQSQHRSVKLRTLTMLSILLLGLSIPAAGLIASAGASPSLYSLNVTIQTTEALPFQYALTAYNTSGYQVASFSGNYPQAAFGLPIGTYLITASAYYQQSYACNICPLENGAVNGTAISTPIPYMPSHSEYGYAVEKLTGPAQITITTTNSTQASLVSLPIHVQFYNGTAASGAYVSAYVVGANNAYPQNWTSSGQTGTDGNFTLVMPEAPIQVTASLSVPINLPRNFSTTTVVVGGQKVNVMVYWQPNYVNLSGQALVLPPQSGAEITMQVQHSYPYPVAYSEPGTTNGGSVTTVTTTIGTATAIPQAGASTQTNRIAPFNPGSSQLSSTPQQTTPAAPGFSAAEGVIIGLGAVAVVGLGLVLVLERRSKSVQSARP